MYNIACAYCLLWL